MPNKMTGLKIILIGRGLKMSDLARKIDVHYSSFMQYVNGFVNPPERVIQDMCKELNISRSDLYKVPDGLNTGVSK
jgi:transcriptional regulator with XRE-family HTH domain